MENGEDPNTIVTWTCEIMILNARLPNGMQPVVAARGGTPDEAKEAMLTELEKLESFVDRLNRKANTHGTW